MRNSALLWIRASALMAVALAVSTPAHAKQFRFKVCNNGRFTVEAARVRYVNSFLWGETYHADGWWKISPGDCEVLYDDDVWDEVYFGFIYIDANNQAMEFDARPERNDNMLMGADVRMCTSNQAFNYLEHVSSSMRECRPGFHLTEFSLLLKPDGGSASRGRFDLTGP